MNNVYDLSEKEIICASKIVPCVKKQRHGIKFSEKVKMQP